METFEIQFRIAAGGNREQVEEEIEYYLVRLARSGQILGYPPAVRVRGGYRVFARVPRADALKPRMGNRWTREKERSLRALGVGALRYRHIGRVTGSRAACGCRRWPYLVLFGDALVEESPVRCGECFGAVPLYTLPPTSDAGDFADVLDWQDTYQACAGLFIGSGAGERFGYRQTSDHKSPLSQEGRALAVRLEAVARVPVYYFLAKYYGFSVVTERRRRCPSCGKKWLLSVPQHSFDFRCDPCRLVSHVADAVRP